jgi:formylglycine-generating enzyme required for sulfatase activity
MAMFIAGINRQIAVISTLKANDAVKKDVAVAEEMKPYKQSVKDTDVAFDMVPIPGGNFMMGSPDSEEKRVEDEGPQHLVKIEPFWMGKCEVTWQEYDCFRLCLDKQRRDLAGAESNELDKTADGVTRPTKEYQPMDFKMGYDGKPAICMTQLSAKMYCKWLTEKTGIYHRLPTEAEWEYACRAGTTTAYSFGNDASMLEEYAWYYDNSDEKYHDVGTKKANPWGLYDMHGNVSEWCIDFYEADFYKQFNAKEAAVFPVAIPKSEYPRVVRGGSWDDDPEFCRSAARNKSEEGWKTQDPQSPKSMWWLTDAPMVGFRIIRPLKQPTEEEIKKHVLYPDIYEELMKENALSSSCK